MFSVEHTILKKEFEMGKMIEIFYSFHSHEIFSQEVSALTPMDMRSSLWFSIKSLLGIF